MISGKGGVGKTSLASSLALRLAAEGHTTLVVSTDPAHSLSDSLAQDVSGGAPKMVEGTDLPLWAMEIDPEREKDLFKEYARGQGKRDVEEAASSFGLSGALSQLSELKLGELLNTPPPGFDEAAAIAKVHQLVTRGEYARFSRIVFDTAPTGHTLRLLTAPDFAEAALEKLARLRARLDAAPSALRALFQLTGEWCEAEGPDRLAKLRESIALVRALLRDATQMEFVVATIPTQLAVQESARLLGALRRQGVPCRAVVVNQVLGPARARGPGAPDAFLKARLKDQARALEVAARSAALAPLRAARAPFLDLEVRGLPALSYFGGRLWDQGTLAALESGENGTFEDDGGPRKNAAGQPINNRQQKSLSRSQQRRRFYMLGGKGGVGKTSCSAALGVRLAEEGHRVLVVSTDPAHSLSDSLARDVGGGGPVAVLDAAPGSLDAMELELDAEREELRRMLRGDEASGSSSPLGGVLGSIPGVGSLLEQLRGLELGELLDTPPPGLDEAIAIAKVVQLLDSEEYAAYDRVVFDTAPTGHTLRLLSLPDFLDTGIGKILLFKQRVEAIGETIKGFFRGNQEKKKSTLDVLREQLAAAKRLFHDRQRMQFVAVTIPTLMAVAETERLVASLNKEGIPVGALVVNQARDGVIADESADAFLKNRRKDQERAVEELRSMRAFQDLDIILAPQFDLEVRGLPALDYFGRQVWTSRDEGQ